MSFFVVSLKTHSKKGFTMFFSEMLRFERAAITILGVYATLVFGCAFSED